MQLDIVRTKMETPEERLIKLQQKITQRAIECWEMDDDRRGKLLPFRESRQTKVTTALMRIDPMISFRSFRSLLVDHAKRGTWHALYPLCKLGETLTAKDFQDVREALIDRVTQGNDDDLLVLKYIGKALSADAFVGVRELLVTRLRNGSSFASSVLWDIVEFLPHDAWQDARTALVDEARKGVRSAFFTLEQLKKYLSDYEWSMLIDFEIEVHLHAMDSLGEFCGLQITKNDDYNLDEEYNLSSEIIQTAINAIIEQKRARYELWATEKVMNYRWRFFSASDLQMIHLLALAIGNHPISLTKLSTVKV